MALSEINVNGTSVTKVDSSIEQNSKNLANSYSVYNETRKYVYTSSNDSENDSLIVSDVSGYAIAKFSEGEIQTKKFNSKNIAEVFENKNNDLDIVDSSLNSILRVYDGELKTKNFDSSTTPNIRDASISSADLDITDGSGNVILRLINGNIKTKNFDSENNNFCSDKNIVLFGDSITWLGGDYCTNNNSWTKYFKEKLSPNTIRSYARGGATWTNTPNTKYDLEENTSDNSDDNVLYNQINRLIYAYESGEQLYPDVIIIAMGVNDAMLYERNGSDSGHRRPDVYNETASDVFDVSTNSYITNTNINTITTLARSIRYNCELIIQKFPLSKVIILTPLQSLTATNEHLINLSNIINECSNRLSIPCIRQENECGIWRIRENISRLFTSDGVHLNSTGGQHVGYFLANRLKNLFII